MRMTVIILNDVDNCDAIYGVIITRRSVQEIQDNINQTKWDMPSAWSVEDLIDGLPEDCMVVDVDAVISV